MLSTSRADQNSKKRGPSGKKNIAKEAFYIPLQNFIIQNNFYRNIV